MSKEKENILKLLEELTDLIKNNEKEDGTFAFDPVKAQVVLDFAKTEIEKSIQKWFFGKAKILLYVLTNAWKTDII